MTRSPLRVRQWNTKASAKTVVSIRHTRAVDEEADILDLKRAMAAYAAALAGDDGWYAMADLPPVGMVIALTGDGRMMFWEAKLLRHAMAGDGPNHLQFPAQWWRYPPPLPEAS